VGFAIQSMIESTLPGKGELKSGDLKYVWTSDLDPGSVFAARNRLGEGLLPQSGHSILSVIACSLFVRNYL
jgi:hypothetical protein